MENPLALLSRYLSEFLLGARVTLQVTAIALALGLVVGLPTAILRTYGKGWLAKLATGYTTLFRGTPVLVQLFLVYYGLPEFGITFSRMMAAYITLGLNSGAYQAEYLRGAFYAIDEGQIMAARAIGMTRIKAIWYIILPQALRLAIPAWSNEVIGLLKATAVVFLIAVPDLMAKAKILTARYFNPIETYASVAVVYLILVFLVSTILHAVERRLRIPGLTLDTDRQK